MLWCGSVVYMLDEYLEVSVSGGLGNQLFMFYAGLFFSSYLKKEPKFDVSDLNRVRNLHPGFNVVDLGLLDDYELIEPNKNDRSTLYKMIGRISDEWRKLSGLAFFPSEIGYSSPRSIPLTSRKLKGYFQTWRYFDALDVMPNLLAAIEAKVSPWALQLGETLVKEDALCLHVRRGDARYSLNGKLGILSMRYFEQVLEMHPSNPVWIFSDSPSEIERELAQRRISARIVNHPLGSDPIDALYLMSKGSNLAISNSTFSWWAAMLSKSKEKIYAPLPWFKELPEPLDLIPSTWLRIESFWEN